MPEIPELSQTIDAVYKKYVDAATDWRRDHLGASTIGRECERRIWYSFRWCSNPDFDGRMHRLFATGYNQEERLINDLKNIGVEVFDKDPETNKQIHYVDFGGHYSGSLDAIGKGFPEAPATFHVIECKTMNTRGFNKLKEKGVKLTKFEHYCQMQVYMGWSGLERAFYFVVCKETDELYNERVHFDQEVFDRLRLKADRIIFATTPSFKISDSPTDFRCSFCEHKSICHGKKLPEVNCRTCAFSDVIGDGCWKCTRCNTVLDSLQQRSACRKHVFIPQLVPMEQTDADDENGWIAYGDIVNGDGAIPSIELQKYVQASGGSK